MTFLAIDVGNTRLKWALYSAPKPGAGPLHHGAVFLEAIDDLAETAWKNLPAPVEHARQRRRRRRDSPPRRSAAGDLGRSSALGRGSASAGGVSNGYDHPNRLGVDRWVALIGARHRVLARGAPRPVLVIMVGTAVTVDALDTSGRFLGGLILPGFGLMLRALEMGTAGLKGADRRGRRLPHQHQRRLDEQAAPSPSQAPSITCPGGTAASVPTRHHGAHHEAAARRSSWRR